MCVADTRTTTSLQTFREKFPASRLPRSGLQGALAGFLKTTFTNFLIKIKIKDALVPPDHHSEFNSLMEPMIQFLRYISRWALLAKQLTR